MKTSVENSKQTLAIALGNVICFKLLLWLFHDWVAQNTSIHEFVLSDLDGCLLLPLVNIRFFYHKPTILDREKVH